MSNRIENVWIRFVGAITSACPRGNEARPRRPRFRDAESSAASTTLATGRPVRLFRKNPAPLPLRRGWRKCEVLRTFPLDYQKEDRPSTDKSRSEQTFVPRGPAIGNAGLTQ